MTKRLFPIAAAFLLSISCPANAADNVLYTIPERNPGGKLLSQTDVINGRKWARRVNLPEIERTSSPFFSSNGSVFYASAGDTLCIASAEEGIVYGESVSRNEFGINGGTFPSPDNSRLAFYRKDESRVGTFPLMDIRKPDGGPVMLRYPMNGTPSERLSLGVFDILSRRTVWIEPTDFDDERYLTGVSWSPDSKTIYIQVLARNQHEMHLNAYSAADGSFKRTILSESNDAWVEPEDPVWFLKGRSDLFIYRTDNRDGWSNLYICDTLGTFVRRITPCNADVSYVCNDGNYVWYCSAEVSPVENHLFRVPLKFTRRKGAFAGKAERLTTEPGWHDIRPLEEGKGFCDYWSSYDLPGKAVRRDYDGRILEEYGSAADPLDTYARCAMEFGTVKSADGLYDNYYRLIKPLGWNPQKKYPVIVYVYGGPHSQMVKGSWLGSIRMWEMLMAQRGFVVYVQDNRGTRNRGAAFEKAINRRCGQAEAADQMEGVKMLRSLPWVDTERMGVYGWSYGGFMTITLMTAYPDVFKAGVAGGPVIDWKWYEVMYGERYMDTPETNPDGFALTRLEDKADRLKGSLLIMQGQLDNTVLNINSLSFIQNCVKEGKLPDYFPYPLSEHNVHGIWRAQMNSKITAFFEEKLNF